MILGGHDCIGIAKMLGCYTVSVAMYLLFALCQTSITMENHIILICQSTINMAIFNSYVAGSLPEAIWMSLQSCVMRKVLRTGSGKTLAFLCLTWNTCGVEAIIIPVSETFFGFASSLEVVQHYIYIYIDTSPFAHGPMGSENGVWSQTWGWLYWCDTIVVLAASCC